MNEELVRIELRRLALALRRPYRLSYRTFREFEPILVIVEDASGAIGFGDGHISPGSSSETREAGWAFCREVAGSFVGAGARQCLERVLANFARSPVAATALASSLECLLGSPYLDDARGLRIPLLAPIGATDPAEVAREVETLLAEGFVTFKIKVGRDVEADIERVQAIQAAAQGRATLRIDANRGYDREQGERFAGALDPAGVELFEQPCDAADWEANAAVARASRVPLMLDEPICSLADIDRAGGSGQRRLLQAQAEAIRQPGAARLRPASSAGARHGAGAR